MHKMQKSQKRREFNGLTDIGRPAENMPKMQKFTSNLLPSDRHHTPWMTEMFMPRPSLKTMTQRMVSTTMLPSTSVSLNSSPPREEMRTSTTSAGSMPARSKRRAKQTMP